MKRGLMICGLVLVVAVPAFAALTDQYYSTGELINMPTLFQRGYIAGVHDALAQLESSKDSSAEIHDTLLCMDPNTDKLSTLTGWALRRLNDDAATRIGPNNSAVDTMMVFSDAHPCSR
ncbi:MAG TPA: hypothetical protein VKV57_08400 [bacterium]|nr:hypothetical protein [bacterium]